MSETFLGNSLADWVWAFGWALGATLAVSLLRSVVAKRLAGLASRTDTVADDFLVESVRSIRKTYVLIIAFGLAVTWLNMPGYAHRAARAVVIVVAVLQALRTANVLAEFGIKHYGQRKDSLDRTTLRALSYAVRFFVFTAIILVGMESAGFEVKTLLTGLGVGGIAIALAVQNILGDLFAALSIVLDKPFVVGDSIAVDAFEGDVVHIGLKSTRVRSINGEEVVFSNADLLRSRLRNLTRRDSRRYGITLHLGPSATADQVARIPAIVADAVRADGRSTLQRSHLKALSSTGAEVESSILIGTADWNAALDIRHSVLLAIMRGLEKEKIPLAQSGVVVAPSSSAQFS